MLLDFKPSEKFSKLTVTFQHLLKMAIASSDTSLRFLLQQLNESTYLKTDKRVEE